MRYGFHPTNLLFRFCLEVFALILYVQMGYAMGEEVWRYVLAILLPLMVATAWGMFNVPGDRSRSGKTVVRINGLQRLILEGILFLSPMIFLFADDSLWMGLFYGTLVILHYVLSLNRVRWLLSVGR